MERNIRSTLHIQLNDVIKSENSGYNHHPKFIWDIAIGEIKVHEEEDLGQISWNMSK